MFGAPADAGRSARWVRGRFRLYFAGQVASASGNFVQQTAIGWLVLRLTGSAAEVGLVLAVGGVPSLLFGPWGGTVADRVNLRRLLIGTQTDYCVLAGLLWALAVAGKASVAVIVAISLAGGVVQIVDSPARQAFVGSLVMPGAIISAAGARAALLTGAAACLVAAAIAARVHTPPHADAALTDLASA